ncbi:hypothetical protein DY000_02008478 [Brassica cretica]|uniref:Neprosin activation peptide domain-containing protein n=1 Tax=Brassica cretica TaxID=69181 RepID=A0ABQ7BYW7_BRACR|nr:hypothetical protein DY000_02008478 [Brassica cretica]
MANKATFHLLMIFCLTLSQFFFFFPTNASRFGSLMERPDQIFLPQQDTILAPGPTTGTCHVEEDASIADKRFGSLMERPDQIFLPQQDTILDVEKRVTMELNDYPGSGANNRHLPRGRGCIDC